MFTVIFEVRPKKERWNDYLDLAKQLKPKLEAIDGFIDNERFGSKSREGVILSLSTWRDEKSVVRWRTQGEHHGVQKKGRFEVFENYHLRVGEVVADTTPPRGIAIDQKRFDETETGAAKFCTITEIPPDQSTRPNGLLDNLRLDPRAGGLLGHELFESITNPGKFLILGSWRDNASAHQWKPDGPAQMRHRLVRVIRDYGMFDRAEAPQFYPAVEQRAHT